MESPDDGSLAQVLGSSTKRAIGGEGGAVLAPGSIPLSWLEDSFEVPLTASLMPEAWLPKRNLLPLVAPLKLFALTMAMDSALPHVALHPKEGIAKEPLHSEP